jgi:hypothetical protein
VSVRRRLMREACARDERATRASVIAWWEARLLPIVERLLREHPDWTDEQIGAAACDEARPPHRRTRSRKGRT